MPEENSAEAYLGLGSNLGDKAAMLDAAVAALAATPGIAVTARSRNYRTPPWGDTTRTGSSTARSGS